MLFEDTAAMLGLIAAFVGLAVADIFELPVFDGIASVTIGTILAVTAGWLAYECKGLLIGEAARASVGCRYPRSDRRKERHSPR